MYLHVCVCMYIMCICSVVCRTPEGKIMLYCKGADNIMIDRLAPGHLALENLKRTLAHYGNEGLFWRIRTSLLVYKWVSFDV